MLAVILCVLLWSLIGTVSKVTQAQIDFYQMMSWSNLLSLLAVLAVHRLSGRAWRNLLPKRADTSRLRLLMLPALLGILDCFFYLAVYYGYGHANGVAVLVTQSSWPLMIVLLGMAAFGERMSLRRWVGMALGFAALLVTASAAGHAVLPAGSETDASTAGAGFATLCVVLLGAFSFTLFSVLSRFLRLDAFAGTVWVFLFSLVCSLVPLVLFSQLSLPPRSAWPALLLNGVLINGVSYILWIYAMSSAHAARLTALAFAAPALSTIWLVVFLHEPLIPAYLLGLGMALAGGMLCLSGSDAGHA
ncbi:DMT family transporter [Granulibacter bethesdensis]|uniref:DMT family transporter n=1 Tax=Granulibacter bethesdensis TaxID=364410 RepID=UPI000932E6B6|nr:DMT family transporter [Granulibacter bethesdensis]